MPTDPREFDIIVYGATGYTGRLVAEYLVGRPEAPRWAMAGRSLAKLEEVHSNARLIDESQLDVSKALVLSNVKIKNQANGMEMKYTLVAESEADLKTGKISVTSPIGKGLLGKSIGEIAEIVVPNGVLKFEILEISRD